MAVIPQIETVIEVTKEILAKKGTPFNITKYLCGRITTCEDDFYDALNCGLIADEIVAQIMALIYKQEYISYQETLECISTQNLDIWKAIDCWSFDFAPLKQEGTKITVAIRNPRLLDHGNLKKLTRKYTACFVVTGNMTREMLYNLCVDLSSKFNQVIDTFSKLLVDSPDRADGNQLLTGLLETAVIAQASDVLFLGSGNFGTMSLKTQGTARVLGVLHKTMYKRVTSAVLQVMQLLADTLAETPKSGYLSFDDNKQSVLNDYNLRVEMCMPDPNLDREMFSVTIRLLPKRSTLISLNKLGFEQNEINVLLKQSVHRMGAGGLFIIAGPTNAGKTTTLHAIVSEIDPCEKYIKEIAAPVEYKRSLIEQISLNQEIDTEKAFATHAKSMVRKSPDVLILGEMRSYADLAFALNMALAGTVVLTTMHSSDCASAVERLVRWSPTNLPINEELASAVSIVMAQRLLRMLCPDCKVIDTMELNQEIYAPLRGKVIYTAIKGQGCKKCNYTGYWQRILISEKIVKNNKTITAIEKRKYRELRSDLHKSKSSLWDKGLILVIEGKVSLEELNAQCSPPLEEENAYL